MTVRVPSVEIRPGGSSLRASSRRQSVGKEAVARANRLRPDLWDEFAKTEEFVQSRHECVELRTQHHAFLLIRVRARPDKCGG